MQQEQKIVTSVAVNTQKKKTSKKLLRKKHSAYGNSAVFAHTPLTGRRSPPGLSSALRRSCHIAFVHPNHLGPLQKRFFLCVAVFY
jgi:hypothetical protein